MTNLLLGSDKLNIPIQPNDVTDMIMKRVCSLLKKLKIKLINIRLKDFSGFKPLFRLYYWKLNTVLEILTMRSSKPLTQMPEGRDVRSSLISFRTVLKKLFGSVGWNIVSLNLWLFGAVSTIENSVQHTVNYYHFINSFFNLQINVFIKVGSKVTLIFTTKTIF